MLPIKQRLDKDDHYVGGNTKEFIVLHDTGNVTDSDEGNANYFCTGSRGASSHYFVDNDSITQIVLDNNCSWHCGDGNNKYGINNRNSIGVEQCRVNSVVTATTEANTVELVKYLMAKYKIPVERVVRHYDASRKNCPASFNLDGKWTRWTTFKAKLVAPVPKPTPKPTSVLYRVRKDWKNVASQIGAYTNLASAKALADKNKGYKVYDPNGKLIHPIPAPTPVTSYGVVTADVLNVRSTREIKPSNIIGQLKQGEKVRIDQLMGKWYSIYYGSKGGFVSADYLKRV